MSFHSGQTFVYGETPSASKMQYLWDNDYALADGSGISNDAIIARHLSDGAVLPEALVAGAGTSWDWTSFNPSFTNLTKGNGTSGGAYAQIGKTVFCRFYMVFGTTSAMGNDPKLTLPVTAKSNVHRMELGILDIEDAGTANFYGIVTKGSSTTEVDLFPMSANANYTSRGQFTANLPMVWTTNDRLTGQFVYEAA